MFRGISAASRSCAATSQPLEKRAEPVARLLAAHDRGIRHPVQLNDAARAREWLETMPRMGVVLEHEQSSPLRRHFGDNCVKIVGRAHQAKPPARALPAVV